MSISEQGTAAARHADMRVQIVMREINQGALAGFSSEISEYAAGLVIQALDTFDYQSVQTAWGDGFRAGIAFQKARDCHTPELPWPRPPSRGNAVAAPGWAATAPAYWRSAGYA